MNVENSERVFRNFNPIVMKLKIIIAKKVILNYFLARKLKKINRK